MKIKFDEIKEITGSNYDGMKGWWEFLKSLHSGYKYARLVGDIQKQFNFATVIRIVQKDGGCNISAFSEFNLKGKKK